MSNSSDYASPSHSIAVVGENEPVSIVPVITVLPQGMIVTLGRLNMFMTVDSALALSDIITEGALAQMSVEFEGDFIQ
jgi:hypothetical protein|tara:strand:- start:7 stop:240 length:234 start_codon:yes stop_codon:yes gene_type:complete